MDDDVTVDQFREYVASSANMFESAHSAVERPNDALEASRHLMQRLLHAIEEDRVNSLLAYSAFADAIVTLEGKIDQLSTGTGGTS